MKGQLLPAPELERAGKPFIPGRGGRLRGSTALSRLKEGFTQGAVHCPTLQASAQGLSSGK